MVWKYGGRWGGGCFRGVKEEGQRKGREEGDRSTSEKQKLTSCNDSFQPCAKKEELVHK